MDGRPSSLCSGSLPLLRLNLVARCPSPLHSGAPPLLLLEPTVRHPSLLCSSVPSFLWLGPTNCCPSSLRSGLILQPAAPHRFAQALSLFSGSVLRERGAGEVGDSQEPVAGVHEGSHQRRGVFLRGCDEEAEAVPPPFILGKVSGSVRRPMSRPGERWSKTLMRWCEEAMLVEKIRGEQQRLGVARRDWVGGGEVKEEEEEDDEEEEEEEEEEEQEEKQDEKPLVSRCSASTSPSSLARSYGPSSVTALLRRSPSSLYHN